MTPFSRPPARARALGLGGVEAYSAERLADLGERIARLHLDGEPLGTPED